MLDPRFFQGRWKATAVARTHVVVLAMTREGLEMFLQQNPLAQVGRGGGGQWGRLLRPSGTAVGLQGRPLRSGQVHSTFKDISVRCMDHGEW